MNVTLDDYIKCLALNGLSFEAGETDEGYIVEHQPFVAVFDLGSFVLQNLRLESSFPDGSQINKNIFTSLGEDIIVDASNLPVCASSDCINPVIYAELNESDDADYCDECNRCR